MRIALIGLAAVAGALVFGVQPGSAQFWQGRGTWCTVPPVGGGTWHCGYYSEAQCRASASGLNLGCSRNPSEQWDRIDGKRKGKGKSSQQEWRW